MAEKTIPVFESLAADVWAFVDRRVAAALASLLGTWATAVYQKAREEVDLAWKDLIDRLSGDVDVWNLIDRFDSAKNCKFGVEADFIYWQGLVDGFRLSDEIVKGEVARWLVSAYPDGFREEAEDGQC